VGWAKAYMTPGGLDRHAAAEGVEDHGEGF
jgi:hypothetical protein